MSAISYLLKFRNTDIYKDCKACFEEVLVFWDYAEKWTLKLGSTGEEELNYPK